MTSQHPGRGKGRWWRAALLILSAVVPAALAQLTAKPPAARHIHVESFRYGKDPHEIRVNRGDRLHLTFSARDTGHSFFLDEFDIDAKVSPGRREVLLFRPSDPQAAPERAREVELTAVHPGLLRYLVSKSSYRCHVWCGPMHAFEHGELIIEPNTLLWAGLGLLLGIPLVGLLGLRAGRRGAAPASRESPAGDGRDPHEAAGAASGEGGEDRAGRATSKQVGDGVVRTLATKSCQFMARLRRCHAVFWSRRRLVPCPWVLVRDGDLLGRMSWLKSLLKRRGFQLAWVAAASVVFYLVVLAALFGTKMAGRNLGIMLTWVVWLFLLVCVLTPLGGRLWCLACPLPLLGEAVQRGALSGVRRGRSAGTNNRLFGLNLAWPRWLPGAWLRTVVLLALGTFSILLVADPRFTGWVLLGMIVAALLMALVFGQRAFCRHLCPIAAFVGTYGKTGRLALRARSAEVCANCKVRTCERGSERGWACPYGLCVADIRENDDCGLCTECIKSCVYDNVTLQWRPFASEHGLRGAAEATTAVVLLVLGLAYCVVHLGPWPGVRDAVNILDKDNWAGFGAWAAILWGTALLAGPALVLAAAAAGRALGRTKEGTTIAQRGQAAIRRPRGTYKGLHPRAHTKVPCTTRPHTSRPDSGKTLLPRYYRAAAAGLLPFGLTVWMAFVVPMLTVNFTFVLQSLSDPLGWGWDFFGTAGLPWHPLWPRAVPFIQVGLILFGFARGLRSSHRAWAELAAGPRRALAGMLPSALLLSAVAGWSIVFFAD